MIEVLESAANRELTTIGQLAQELGDIAEGSLLSAYLDRASGIIEEYLERPLPVQTYREKIAGHGASTIMLSEMPVVEITSVTSGGDPILDYEMQDAEAGIVYRKGGWQWSGTLWWKTSAFPDTYTQRFNFVFTYRAGFVLPGEAGRTLPYEIEQACIDLVRHMFLHREDDSTVTSQKTATYSVTYAEGGMGNILRKLDRWKK